MTSQTVQDKPAQQHHGSLAAAWPGFIALAVVTCIAGWVLTEAAKGLADHTGLSGTLVGGLFAALIRY